MPRFNTALPDRAAMALQNALAGHPDASVRSIVAPDTLTPSEHQDLVDRWFGPGESVPKSVARTLTNPLTIVAAAMVWKWPAASMAELAGATKSLQNYDKYLPGWLRWLSGLNEIFTGTPIPGAFQEISRANLAFETKHAMPVTQAIIGVEKSLGRGLTMAEHAHIGLTMDYEGNAAKPTYKFLSAKYRELVDGLKTGRFIAPTDVNPATLSGKMAGLEVAPLPSYLEPIAAAIKASNRSQWDAILGEVDPQKRARMIGQLQKKYGVIQKDLAPELDGYYSHVRIRDVDEVLQENEDTVREVLRGDGLNNYEGLKAANVAQREMSAAETQVSPSQLMRYNTMLPSAKQLQVLADEGIINQEFATQAGLVNRTLRMQPNMGPLPEYDLRAGPAWKQYTNANTRMYSWNLHEGAIDPKTGTTEYPGGIGQFITREARAMMSQGPNAKRKAELLANTYIPSALGHSTLEQYSKSLEWHGLREFASQQLAKPESKTLLGASLHKRLNDMVQLGSPWLTWKGAGAGIAGYLYNTTLGFNIPASAQNLTQNLLTTASLGVKPRYLLEGFEQTVKEGRQYLKLLGEGMGEEEALALSSPSFHRQAVDLSPEWRQKLWGLSDVGPLEGETGAGVVGGWLRNSMKMFQASERFNRMMAYNSVVKQGLAEGMEIGAAEKVGTQVVNLAQAWGGVNAMPSGLINVWQPLRQYGTFPAKLLAQQGLAAMNYGGPFNPGNIGRAVIGSVAAYELARGALDTDISSSLVWGALPSATSGRPFSPMPVVPPLLNVAGSAAMDVAGGTTENLRRALPTLVPGGIQASRAVGMVSPTAAKALGKPYADYENMTPDGRFPMYGADGNLIGYLSQGQLLKRSLGIADPEMQDEQAITRYLIKQRDQIRDYRRRYMEAMFVSNDSNAATRIDNEFQRRFGIGPIKVKKQDIKAIWMRRDVGRLEKVLDQMPPEARAVYGPVAAVGLGAAGQDMLGVDPSLLGTGTMRSRRPQANPYSLAGTP